jgi:hypothetical protein
MPQIRASTLQIGDLREKMPVGGSVSSASHISVRTWIFLLKRPLSNQREMSVGAGYAASFRLLLK